MKTVDDLFKLRGKVAVLIGGTGYLGSAIGRGLQDVGVSTCVLDIHAEKPANLGAYPDLYLSCDATSKTQLEACRETILKRFRRIDILLNAAGLNQPTPFMEIETDELDRILHHHVHATIYACQVFGETMLQQKSGSIINFASASSGPPLSKAFIYSVAKAGIANLTQNLGREWAQKGVRVNALRPGFFPTEWSMKNFIDEERKGKILGHTPMARFGKPEELLGAALWLASDAASFVTGSIVAVDGGFTAMTI